MNAVKNTLNPLNPLNPLNHSSFRISGAMGKYLDTVLQARINSTLAAEEIYPEAIRAFEERMDDRIKPDEGFWRGEFWGKWTLSALAAYRYTLDPILKKRIRAGVDQVLATQDENGYIGTYHDSSFVKHRGKMCWNVWSRKYTLWGLAEAFELFQDQRILKAASRMLDHLIQEVGPDAVPIIETGKLHGQPSTSILFPVLILYRLTSEQRYLQYAEYIVEQWSQHPEGPPDIFRKGLEGKPIHTWFPNTKPWVKAYEFVSAVEGLLEFHKLTGNPDYLTAVRNIHADILKNERLIIGGISDNDRMNRAPLKSETITEVCDAVYWQRLNLELLKRTGEQTYADEVERTLYNALLGAMKRDGSWGLRRLALAGEHWPAPQHCGLTHHHCCVANLPRGLLQAVENALMTDREGLILNFYLPGKAQFETPLTGSLQMQITTDYPVSGEIRIAMIESSDKPFTLKLRIPPWSLETRVEVNGELIPARPGTYLSIHRHWKSGDEINLSLDLRTRVVRFPDPSQKLIAFERGPLVLARDQRLESEGENIHSPTPLDPAASLTLSPVPASDDFLATF